MHIDIKRRLFVLEFKRLLGVVKQCIVLMRGQSKDLWILVKGEAKDDQYNRKASFLF